MAIIPQQKLFGWEQIEGLGDLERLRLVISYMPDEELMRLLEKERGLGRNDYPIRGIWNALLAGIVFQHISAESLLRELSRNGQLRELCGLSKVPTSSAFSRFLAKLMRMDKEIDAIFNNLLRQITYLVPDFGQSLAIDGKAILTHARPRKKETASPGEDGRRDTDANFGKKVYRGRREDGTLWEKVTSWFGYRLHLIVDAAYELPVAFNVTKASPAEAPQAHALLNKLEKIHPEILERCEYLMADRGYDDGKLFASLWDKYTIKPIIAIRNLWKDGEETRLLTGKDNVVYNYCGNVYCYCPKTGLRREMAYAGFEKDRDTLKCRCPAEQYGKYCAGKEDCPVKSGVRIPLEEDRRIFTPVARPTYKWGNLYNMRTSVERVNSRLDVSFGFEKHYIRGLKKMRLRVGLALAVMLAMALGRIKENQMEKLRSLVKAA